METKMKNTELAAKATEIAKNYKTLYIMGCFGAPMNDKNKKRYTSNNVYNEDETRTKLINAASADTFGFDCIGLIKGILWGWNGDLTKTYGGAVYKSGDVPDIGADKMITVCSDVSEDFSHLEIGEAVWMSGHIGIYIGDGLAVECSPKWEDKVQITACNCKVAGYNTRNWTKHGKMPYVEYVKEEEIPETPEPDKGDTEFGLLDVVAIKDSVTTYYNGKTFPSWVKNAKLYVRKTGDDGTVTVSTKTEGAVTGTFFKDDLILIEKATEDTIPDDDENSETQPPVTEPEEDKEEQTPDMPKEDDPDSDPDNQTDKDSGNEKAPEPSEDIPNEDDGDNDTEDEENDTSPEKPEDDTPETEEPPKVDESDAGEADNSQPTEEKNMLVRMIRAIINFIIKLFGK